MMSVVENQRYFENPFLRSSNHGGLSDASKSIYSGRIKQLADMIMENTPRFIGDVDGGLYVGPAGIAYALWRLTDGGVVDVLDGEDSRSALRDYARQLVDRNRLFYEGTSEESKNKKNIIGFLLGSAGVNAVGAAIAYTAGDTNGCEEFCRKFHQASGVCLESMEIHKCGSDELFVGRAGYVTGSLFLRNVLKKDVVPLQRLRQICDIMVDSGRSYRRGAASSYPPLMYAYYGTEYLGAAHGLCAILETIISVPGYLNGAPPDVVRDIQQSVDYLVGLQTPSGNLPCAATDSDKAEPELVHWCHGSPGTVYLFAKFHLITRETKYLEAALRCGECVWRRGLLKKGPGICHGVAGSGYVFLLLYRLTGDVKQLQRAIHFADFIYTEEFRRGARTPDCPYSLYEGVAGTLCFLVDLLQPQKAAFPFSQVFENN